MRKECTEILSVSSKATSLATCNRVPDSPYSLFVDGSRLSRIGTIVQAKTINRKRPATEYFALTVATGILTSDQSERIELSTHEFSSVADEVAIKWLGNTSYMAVEGGDAIDITSPPKFLYKYWARSGDNSEWSVLQNIAIMKLESEHVLADGLLDRRASCGIDGLFAHDCHAFIMDFYNKEAVARLVGSKILCRGYSGVLTPHTETGNSDFVMGASLMFKFDDPDLRLKSTDVGSLVYLAEKVDGKLPILGMFFGQILKDTRIHCATILSWNIKLVMHAKELLKLDDIRLATCSCEVQVETLGEAQLQNLAVETQSKGEVPTTSQFPLALVSACTSNQTNLEEGVGKRNKEHGRTSSVQHATTPTEVKPVPNETRLKPVEDSLSQPFDQSDNVGEITEHLDETEQGMHSIDLDVTPVTDKEIKLLYNSDQVYKMKSPTRGRCLIINIKNFDKLKTRDGSEKDVENIRKVFGKLSFICKDIHDLSAEEVKRAIEEETQHPDHKQYDMFTLFIMSHGMHECICGKDSKFVQLAEVYNLLSYRNFPAMAGKPKLVAIQACGGKYVDTWDVDADGPDQSDLLASSDLFIVMPSFHGHKSIRHFKYGSLLVRALLVALCKYSCRMDFEMLFNTLVKPAVVRKSCYIYILECCDDKEDDTNGLQEPRLETSPSKKKKLYLFPGYDPAQDQ